MSDLIFGGLGFNHDRPIFVMLAGLPGSGKSTLRAGFDKSAVVLSTDDWIEEKAQWEGTTYDAIWARDIDQATSAMNAAFRQAIKDRANIILDRTNLTVKGRRKYLSQLPKEYYTLCLFVQTDEDTRQDRLKSRPGKVIPKHADDRMLETLVVPTTEEGFDKVMILTNGAPTTGLEKRVLA